MRALGRLQIEHREEADRRECSDDGDDCLAGDLIPHGIAWAFSGLQGHVDIGEEENRNANEQEDDQTHQNISAMTKTQSAGKSARRADAVIVAQSFGR